MFSLRTALSAGLAAALSATLTLTAAAPQVSPLTLPVEPTAIEAPAVAGSAQEEKRNLTHFNLGKKNLGLQGYDPVAYFPEGGGKPKKGKKDLTFTHQGVTYRFATKENLAVFQKAPAKYEPAYGGWCAYAIASEDKVDPSPKNFLIQNGRLMLFVKGFFGNAKKLWEKEGAEKLEVKADAYWAKLHAKS